MSIWNAEAFLQNLFVGNLTKIKVASIRQAIMQSVRPRILNMPLQLVLDMQMYRQFGSRFLNDTLNEFDFLLLLNIEKRKLD